VIVRSGLGELPGVLEEVGAKRPFLIASPRWHGFDLPIEPAGGWSEVPSHRIDEAVAEAQAAADSLVAVGGGSAIDLAKAVSAATGLAVVSLPTTYSGAEWTAFFGVRDPDRRLKGGGAGARLGAIVYEPRLTLDLPRPETVGTALNALAHCAEALYVEGRNKEGDREALAGASLIGRALPRVVTDGHDLEARTVLLEGAMHAGKALASAGLGLGHAMAQVLGGTYGLPHGAMNALCLPPALRFNQPVAAEEIARFAQALDTADPVARIEELARPGGFGGLQDHGVPDNELDEVAEAVIARAGARANPRPATAEDVAELLRSIW
jgi:maleylacetate reductase